MELKRTNLLDPSLGSIHAHLPDWTSNSCGSPYFDAFFNRRDLPRSPSCPVLINNRRISVLHFPLCYFLISIVFYASINFRTVITVVVRKHPNHGTYRLGCQEKNCYATLCSPRSPNSGQCYARMMDIISAYTAKLGGLCFSGGVRGCGYGGERRKRGRRRRRRVR